MSEQAKLTEQITEYIIRMGFHSGLSYEEEISRETCRKTATAILAIIQHQKLCRTCDKPCGTEWSDKEGKCFVCGKPTHWLDMCYEGYVCSLKCQDKASQDVQDIACKDCQKLKAKDVKIAEQSEKIKRLEGMMLEKEDIDELIILFKKQLPNLDGVSFKLLPQGEALLAKLKAQSEYKEEAGK